MLKINHNVVGNTPYLLPDNSDMDFKYELSILENEFPHHTKVIEAINSIPLSTELKRYPYKSNTLKCVLDYIVKYLNNDENSHANISTNQIIITNGSDSALKLICDTYITPTSNILIPTPTYPHFIKFVETSSIDNQDRIHKLHLDYINNDVSQLKNKLINALTSNHYDLVYLVNPNMPLGYSFTYNDIECIIKSHPTTMFIIDEAYYEYSQNKSAVHLLSQSTSPTTSTSPTIFTSPTTSNNNVIITRTFSKGFGLASLRVGYLVSNTINVQNLSVIHNSKNVTLQSLTAVKAVFDNFAYYKSNISMLEDIKKYIKKELDTIIQNNNSMLINGYHIKDGNFFLLKCQNTQVVTKLFYKYKICVRDKHDDIADHVRLSIGNMECVQYVIDVIKKINNPLMDKKVWLIDLDYTLRHGSKYTSKIYDNIKSYINTANVDNNIKIIVITNNSSQNPEKIQEYLIHNGINVHQVCSPLTAIVDMTSTANPFMNNPLIIANDESTQYLKCNGIYTKQDTTDFDSVLFLNDFFNISMDGIIRISEAVHNNKAKFLISENNMSCTALGSADTDNTTNTLIPDIGSYVKMLECINIKPDIVLGKPNNLMIKNILKSYSVDDVVVIGDSLSTDKLLAENNNIDFILFMGQSDDTVDINVKYDTNNNVYTMR